MALGGNSFPMSVRGKKRRSTKREVRKERVWGDHRIERSPLSQLWNKAVCDLGGPFGNKSHAKGSGREIGAPAGTTGSDGALVPARHDGRVKEPVGGTIDFANFAG